MTDIELELDVQEVVEVPIPVPTEWDHAFLFNRGAKDSHPMQAITGLMDLDAYVKALDPTAEPNVIVGVSVNGVPVVPVGRVSDIKVPVSYGWSLAIDDAGSIYLKDRMDGVLSKIETGLSRVVKSGYFDDDKVEIVLVLDDDSEIRIPASDLVDVYTADGYYITVSQRVFDLTENAKRVLTDSTAHNADRSNPHRVTKDQVGLGNADNTSDTDKPVSTRQREALDGKVDKVPGKGLSSEDYTAADKAKLGSVEEFAQVNVIEGIKRNGAPVPVAGKAADISVPTAVSELANDTGYVTRDVADLVNYYKSSDVYTKTEVDNKVAVSGQFYLVLVDELPETGDPNNMYLVRREADDRCDMYLYIGGNWEHMGSTGADVSVVQDASGITVGGAVLQTADASKSGIMSSSQAQSLAGKADASALAPVAFSGRYGDLSEIPKTSAGAVVSPDAPEDSTAGDIWFRSEDSNGTVRENVRGASGWVEVTPALARRATADADGNPIPETYATKASVASKADASALEAHTGRADNPHNVTKEQLGLGNVDDTPDSQKPVSVPQQAALDGKVSVVEGKGLSANDLTDARASKLDALYTKEELDARFAQVIEWDAVVVSALPSEGQEHIIYLVPKEGDGSDVHDEYIWVDGSWELVGSTQIEIGPATESQDGLMTRQHVQRLGAAEIGLSTAQQSIAALRTGMTAVQTSLQSHLTNVGNPHNVTKGQVGLGNVDDTSDLDKPISRAAQAALDAKADASALAQYQRAFASRTVRLTAAGWQGLRQTVQAPGLTPDAAVVLVSYAPDSYEDYVASGVRAVAQGAGTITFACDSVPEGDVEAEVAYRWRYSTWGEEAGGPTTCRSTRTRGTASSRTCPASW